MKWEDIPEFGLAAVTTALSIIAAGTNDPAQMPAQMAALTGLGLFAWQKENTNQLLSILNQKCQRLDREKLDKSALESDEFKALLIQALDTASKTDSELKRKALANALINSVLQPTSKIKGKQALHRVLIGMSDEEMIALEVLYKCQLTGDKGTGKDLINDEKAITSEHLVNKFIFKGREMGLGWSEEDSLVAYDGLKQLELARPQGFWQIEWGITKLGTRLIQWVDEYNKEQDSGEVLV